MFNLKIKSRRYKGGGGGGGADIGKVLAVFGVAVFL